MNYVEEAIGVARAARQAGMPAVISFTVETDGRLPTGQSLRDAIEQDGRGDRLLARLLHDQLRAPDALQRRCSSRGSRGRSRSAACAPTPRRKSHAELNESPSSTPATRSSSARTTPGSAEAPADQRAGRLLRHRRAARRADGSGVHAVFPVTAVRANAIRYFETARAFGEWLEKHRTAKAELWVGFHKKERVGRA